MALHKEQVSQFAAENDKIQQDMKFILGVCADRWIATPYTRFAMKMGLFP